MRKYIVFVLTAISILSLTACGANKGASGNDTDAQVSTAVEGQCSDETFAALQNDYLAVIDSYNAVKELYERDDVEADEELEDIINSSAAIINGMGELSQSAMTEEDAKTLDKSMLDIVNSLTVVADKINFLLAGGCTDATFEMIQNNYVTMVEIFNNVKENVTDDNAKALIDEASGVIDHMGEMNQGAMSEAEAQSLNDNIVALVQALGSIAN